MVVAVKSTAIFLLFLHITGGQTVEKRTEILNITGYIGDSTCHAANPLKRNGHYTHIYIYTRNLSTLPTECIYIVTC
jgi:hypothetical protein